MQKRSLVALTQRTLAAFGLALMLAGCGGGGGGAALASVLYGTWDLLEIEVLTMSTNCPGEIGLTPTDSVSCGTESFTFNADGTFAQIETTDEFGNPFDWRSEGTWSTQGNTLTLTYTQEGPDAGSLQPINPPETQSASWSISTNRLTLVETVPFPFSVTVTGTFQKR